jgi:hypothetical protein
MCIWVGIAPSVLKISHLITESRGGANAKGQRDQRVAPSKWRNERAYNEAKTGPSAGSGGTSPTVAARAANSRIPATCRSPSEKSSVRK